MQLIKSLKMKLQKNIIPYALFIVLAFVSCEKFINIDQPDIIEPEQAFSDDQSVRSAVIGVYGLLANLAEPLYLAGEVRADLITTTEFASAHIKEFNFNSFSSSNKYISAAPYYRVVNTVNQLVSDLEGALVKEIIDTVEFNWYKAELIGIRVWTQYQITRIYGSLRYYTNASDDYLSADIPDLSFEDAITRIKNDLVESDTIAFEHGSTEWETVRISPYFINALMGELFLELEDYENAQRKFNEVLAVGDSILTIDHTSNDDRFKLGNTFENSAWGEMYSENWLGSGGPNEFVFVLAYNNTYNQINLLQEWTTIEGGSYQIRPVETYYENQKSYFDSINSQGTDKELLEYYINQYQISKSGLKDYRVPYSFKIQDEKVIIDKFNADRIPGSNSSPLIITRAARLYLLSMYCSYQRLETTNIVTLISFGNSINKIRLRANAPELNVMGLLGLPDEELKYGLTQLLLEELSLECAFEGQRWFDLVRFARHLNNPSFLVDQVLLKYPEELREAKRAELQVTQNWYIPHFE